MRLARSGPREAIIQLPETLRPALGTVAQAETYSGLERDREPARSSAHAADPATRTFEAKFTLAGAPASAPLGSTDHHPAWSPDGGGRISVPLAAIDDRGTRSRRLGRRKAARSASAPSRSPRSATRPRRFRRGLRPGERFVALGVHLLRQDQSVRIATGAAR